MSKTKRNRKWDTIDDDPELVKIVKPLPELEFVDDHVDCDICTECGTFMTLSGEIGGFPSCDKCGKINESVVDHGSEWRFYGSDNQQSADNARCGIPINPLLEESSFGCKITCNGSSSYEMRKLRRYTEWQSMPYKEKTRYDDIQYITQVCNNAGITKYIIDFAIDYHIKLTTYNQSFRGTNKDGLIAGSVYMACRYVNWPRTPKEISRIFNGMDVSVITQGCRTAQSIINELDQNLDVKPIFTKNRPDLFIDRYCSLFELNSEIIKLCKFIAIKINKDNLMLEHTPNSVAASIIYFVAQICKLAINKHDIKLITDVSEVTVNKCTKKLEIMNLVPAKIMNKYGYKAPV